MKIVAFGAEWSVTVTLLLAGGLGLTVREFRRLSAESKGRNALVVGGGNVAMNVYSTRLPISFTWSYSQLTGQAVARSAALGALRSDDGYISSRV